MEKCIKIAMNSQKIRMNGKHQGSDSAKILNWIGSFIRIGGYQHNAHMRQKKSHKRQSIDTVLCIIQYVCSIDFVNKRQFILEKKPPIWISIIMYDIIYRYSDWYCELYRMIRKMYSLSGLYIYGIVFNLIYVYFF